MKVICIVPEYPPDLPSRDQGGVTTYFMNMVLGYLENGFDVIVLSSACRAEVGSKETGSYGETVIRAFRHRATFGSGPLARMAYEILRELNLAQTVWKHRDRAILMEIPDWQTPLLAPAMLPKSRTYMKLHGPSGFVRRLNSPSAKWWWRLVDFRERFWARRVQLLESGSPVLTDFAVREWRIKRRIPLSPDPFVLATALKGECEPTPVGAAMAAASRNGELVILNVGRFEFRKGQHIVCESLKHLDLEDVRWSIHFVGPDTPTGPGGTSYREFCSRLVPARYQNQVHWHPPVRLSQLHELYQIADLVIVSSLDGNYGYTTLQPLAAGACVITTLEPGQESSQYVAALENGLLYRSDDPAGLARQIHTALDPELRRRLAACAARRAADGMSPRVTAQHILESIGSSR